MSRRIDLEGLKAILSDDRTSIAIGKIQKVEVLEDFSVARAQVTVFPEEYEVIAKCTFPHANMGGGWFTLPNMNDLVLLAFANKDEVYIIGYLSSKEDLIPKNIKDGRTVFKASPTKILELASDTKGLLSKGNPDAPPTEPLVLGNILKTMFTQLNAELKKVTDEIRKLSNEIKTGDILFSGAPGGPTAPNPAFVAKHTAHDTALKAIEDKITAIQKEFITDEPTNIVSKLWFTEKGGE